MSIRVKDKNGKLYEGFDLSDVMEIVKAKTNAKELEGVMDRWKIGFYNIKKVV